MTEILTTLKFDRVFGGWRCPIIVDLGNGIEAGRLRPPGAG